MSFDSIAPVYDMLSRIVFGRSMVKSQRHFLKYIPAEASVLILGGGTGWIIQELFAVNNTCTIVYVEASQKMIDLARRQIRFEDISRVQFILSHEITTDKVYDCVITNFFLDLFTEEQVSIITSKIKYILKDNGCWIVTDFVSEGKLWQRLLLKIMYTFFRIVSKIEAVALPLWYKQLEHAGFSKKASQKFYNGFIETSIYTVTTAR